MRFTNQNHLPTRRPVIVVIHDPIARGVDRHPRRPRLATLICTTTIFKRTVHAWLGSVRCTEVRHTPCRRLGWHRGRRDGQLRLAWPSRQQFQHTPDIFLHVSSPTRTLHRLEGVDHQVGGFILTVLACSAGRRDSHR